MKEMLKYLFRYILDGAAIKNNWVYKWHGWGLFMGLLVLDLLTESVVINNFPWFHLITLWIALVPYFIEHKCFKNKVAYFLASQSLTIFVIFLWSLPSVIAFLKDQNCNFSNVLCQDSLSYLVCQRTNSYR